MAGVLIMIKKVSLILLTLIIILNCGKKQRQAVSWFPLEPQCDEKIKIKYNQQSKEAQLVDAQILLICQFYFNNSDSLLIVPMKKEKNNWQIEIDPPKQTFLLSFKFEDELNRTDDNHGRGWNVFVRDKDNNIAKNSHYYQGQIYSGKIRPDAYSDYKKAILEFKQEIKLYPKNYMAWFDKWEAKENLSISNRQEIVQKLDSLLAVSLESRELLKLSFYTNWKILQKYSKAIDVGEKLLNKFSQTTNIDEIAYSLIFLKYNKNLSKKINELEKFIARYPNSRLIEAAYFRLGNYYLRSNELHKAEQVFEKLDRIAPDNFENKLTLTTMEINNKNYSRAKKLLEQAKNHSSIKELRKEYPWLHPGKRLNRLNLNLCQIYSTIASLDYAEGNFTEAIKNRKAVIKLGTPFPAFEWVGIGNAYLKLKNAELAKKAFIKALTINPKQQDAIQFLKRLYVNDKTSEIGFNDYINNAINDELRASAKLAPDFEAIDLGGNKFRLSDMRGKIIVLYFWDSWSIVCDREIPELDKLVADFKDNNFVEFWAISIEYKTSIEKYLQNKKFDYHKFYNGNEIKKLYRVIGFPTHIVIDSNGYLRYKYIGYNSNIKQKLKDNIQFLLKERDINVN